MGMAGMDTAVTFGNSTVGRFLDTFCFHPDTRVCLADGREIAMADVQIGMELACGATGKTTRVTSKMRFDSNPQKDEMYSLAGIRVSGNHYVIYEGQWIHVRQHPDASRIVWDVKTPLICFNTARGTIPIRTTSGWLTFSDYDEDRTADAAVMAAHEATLGSAAPGLHCFDYSLGVGGHSWIRMKSDTAHLVQAAKMFGHTIAHVPSWRRVKDVNIGDDTYYGHVLAVIEEECEQCVRLRSGDLVSEAMFVWDAAIGGYTRAGVWTFDGTNRARKVPGKRVLRNFILAGYRRTGLMELKSGAHIRDYLEAPCDTQVLYDNAMATAQQ
jgi:hypothetical protein